MAREKREETPREKQNVPTQEYLELSGNALDIRSHAFPPKKVLAK
jgi:hypothetical protein